MAAAPDEFTATATIDIDAPPERVYDLIADVARVGEFSPEATGCAWRLPGSAVRRALLGSSTSAARGGGSPGAPSWSAERGRRFSFDVDFPPMPVSRWTYDIEPTDSGCRVTETWNDRREGPVAAPIKWIGGVIIPGPRAPHNQRNIETTLQRLKAAAEKG
jgi:hypothetical protein